MNALLATAAAAASAHARPPLTSLNPSTRKVSLGSSSLIRPRGLITMPRADGSDPKAMVEQINRAFEEFKASNDQKLNAKVDDALVNAKVEAINAELGKLQAAIDQMNADAAATRASAGRVEHEEHSPEERAYAAAYAAFIRNGDRENEVRAGSRLGIRAALSEGTQTAGGYFTPIEWDRTITGALKLISPIRQIATVQPTTKIGFSKVYSDRNIGSGWVGETAARPQTTTPGLTLLTFASGELYCNPNATQDLLEDGQVDVQTWLANEVDTEFARQEGIAFLSGTGVNMPKGLLVDTSHPFGVPANQATATAGKINADDIINLVYGLPAVYAAEARYIMNRNTQGVVRGLKDTTGRYLWQPAFEAGQPATLLAYPITETPDMPNVATGNIPIVFGNFKVGYLIVDRLGTTVLRDPFTNKPYVSFYTRKRVGGGINEPQALIYLKVT